MRLHLAASPLGADRSANRGGGSLRVELLTDATIVDADGRRILAPGSVVTLSSRSARALIDAGRARPVAGGVVLK